MPGNGTTITEGVLCRQKPLKISAVARQTPDVPPAPKPVAPEITQADKDALNVFLSDFVSDTSMAALGWHSEAKMAPQRTYAHLAHSTAFDYPQNCALYANGLEIAPDPAEYPLMRIYSNFFLDNYNESVTSAFAQQLYSDGYAVAEARIPYQVYYTPDPYDPAMPSGDPDAQATYHIVCVKIGDTWYVAEETII